MIKTDKISKSAAKGLREIMATEVNKQYVKKYIGGYECVSNKVKKGISDQLLLCEKLT